MPPKSKSQQRAAGAALAAKRKGESPKGKGAVASMASSMNEKQLKEFATSPAQSTLPNKLRNPKSCGKGRIVSE